MNKVEKRPVLITITNNDGHKNEIQKNRTVYHTKTGYVIFYRGKYIPVIVNDHNECFADFQETTEVCNETPVVATP